MDRANELPGVSHLPHHMRYGCCVSCTAGKSFIVLKADAYRGYSGHMVFPFTHFAVQHLKHNSSTMYHACLVSFRDGDNANDADT
jgi:hypothetical protein